MYVMYGKVPYGMVPFLPYLLPMYKKGAPKINAPQTAQDATGIFATARHGTRHGTAHGTASHETPHTTQHTTHNTPPLATIECMSTKALSMSSKNSIRRQGQSLAQSDQSIDDHGGESAATMSHVSSVHKNLNRKK